MAFGDQINCQKSLTGKQLNVTNTLSCFDLSGVYRFGLSRRDILKIDFALFL